MAVAGTAPPGDKSCAGPNEGWVTGYLVLPGTPPTRPWLPPSLKRHLPPSRPVLGAQPQEVPSKHCCPGCSAHSRLCLGVFTRVTVRVCLDRASRAGLPRPGLTLAGGPWERGAGWVSGSPLIKSSWPRQSQSRPTRPGVEPEGQGLGPATPNLLGRSSSAPTPTTLSSKFL